MSTVTFLVKFVFTTLLLASVCMAHNPWFPNGANIALQPVRRGTSTGVWGSSESESSIFVNDNYTVDILLRSMKDIVRFSILYLLSLLTKLFPDRHQYLRYVADGINGVVDCFSHYYHLVLNILFAIPNIIRHIPIVGLVVTIPLWIFDCVMYIPNLVIEFVVTIIKGVLL